MTEQAISPLRRRMRRPNMTMCNGSRTSRDTSSALPIPPHRKMYAAFSCIDVEQRRRSQDRTAVYPRDAVNWVSARISALICSAISASDAMS